MFYRNYEKLRDEDIEELALSKRIAAGTSTGYDRQYAIQQLRSRDNAQLAVLAVVVAILLTAFVWVF